MRDSKLRLKRIQNALWGLFIGDALAMPVHWYYNPNNIKKDFNGGITTYEAARHPHPESFMVGMGYHPDVETARRIKSPFDILHEHVRFYSTSYHRLDIDRSERDTEHGNPTPSVDERYHYHHGLLSGENTLGAHLLRVLMRSVVSTGRYDQMVFIGAFINYLTTPGFNRDPYTEIYVRRWFEQYTRGMPPHACAEIQRHSWSIGSHGGLIRPLVISLLAGSPYQGIGLAIEHQNLTHRSENNVAALSVLVPLLHELVSGTDGERTTVAHARQIRLPIVTGSNLFARYRQANGPGNIPNEEMWQLHTWLDDVPMDIPQLLNTYNEETMTHDRLATACYPEHGLPMMLYLAVQKRFDLESALLANANAGGDNVHRGMVLGLLVGAASEEVPTMLKTGLVDHVELATEIEAFSEMAVTSAAF